MSLFATAKVKAAKGNLSEAFKNEDGAIDLASIMVGIIVIGMIGGVIAATVFTVIPWAQDNAAQQQLDSVAAAQAAYIGYSADQSNTAIRFATKAELASKGLFNGNAEADLVIHYSGSGTSAHYAAAMKSDSGKWFKITDTKTNATDIGAIQGAENGTGAAHTATTLSNYTNVVNAS